MLGIIFLILRILAAVTLFAFLAWALRLIWLDLKRQAQPDSAPERPDLVLAAQGDLSNQGIRLTAGEIIVGRDPACGLYLTDKTISGQHARLEYRLNQWWVEDLQSTNKTFLNGHSISSPVVLADGDELRFGQLEFKVGIGVGIEASADKT